jgi:proteasome lid subunit RPN8/RPN11
MPWTDCELGGVLLGTVEKDRVVVAVVPPNPGGPQEPTRTTIEYDAFLSLETVAVPAGRLPIAGGRPRRRIVGSVHSHPVVGPPVPSPQDLANAKRGSMLDRQDNQTFVEMIVAPRSENWAGGDWDGYCWDEPFVRAWVAVSGEVWSTVVTQQPKWQWAFEDEQRALREEAANATQ